MLLDESLCEEVNKCCICGKEFEGYGNNAEPICKGKCCDKCNNNVVIPARIKQLSKNESIEGDTQANQDFQDRNANYEKDREADRQAKVELAKHGITAEEKNIKEDFDDVDLYEPLGRHEEKLTAAEELYNDLSDAGYIVYANEYHPGFWIGKKNPKNLDRAIDICKKHNFKCKIDKNRERYILNIAPERSVEQAHVLGEDTTLSNKAVDGGEMVFEVKDDGTFTIYQDGREQMTNKVVDAKTFIDQLKSAHFKVKEEKLEPALTEDKNLQYIMKCVTVAGNTLGDIQADFNQYNVKVKNLTDDKFNNQFKCVDIIGAKSDLEKLKSDEGFENEIKPLAESLTEDLDIVAMDGEEIDQLKSAQESGLVTMINDLITDENEAINGYESAIVNLEVNGKGELTDAIREILNDEQKHIGSLQAILDQIKPDTQELINAGNQETAEILNAESASTEDPEEGMHY